MASAGALASGLLLAVSAQAQTRPFTASDMLGVVQISGTVAVSPDGGRLAFVLPDLTEDWNVLERTQVGTVHVANATGSSRAPVPIGPAGQRSSFPVFSPDGTRLALFLEDDEGGGLAIWHLSDRRMERVGAPFDRRVIYARPPPLPPATPPERSTVLETSDALPGDEYFRRDPRAGLRLVDLTTGDEQTLVPDGSPLRRFDVSPDGSYATGTLADRRRTLLWSFGADGRVSEVGQPSDRPVWMADGRLLVRRPGVLAALTPDRPDDQPETLFELGGPLGGLLESPDGALFAGLQADPSITDPEIEPPQRDMYTIARPFLDLVLVSASDGGRTNVTAGIPDQIRSPTWSHDGRAIYFVATNNQTYDETLFRYDVRSGQRTSLASGRESFSGLVPIPGALLASVQSATTPGDLWRFDEASGERTRVTELNPQLEAFEFSEPELFHFNDQSGDRLGALLYRATGPASGADEPIITYVYEKLTPNVHRFQPRQQLFATHGYTVLMPNVLINVGAPGTSYVESVVPAVQAVHDMGFTNGRACMWGGSFGAYATSYVITQTNIFDCAVSRATPPELFRNWASGRDRDSENIERGQARMGGSPFEVQDRYLSQSAFFHLDQVETPVLITHGMKDYTILFEEGAMMFYALRRLGKEATFVAYRDGDHSLYRNSRADALDVHQRMLDWFALYLR
jgi:dipeptidyl aminopeptidase/acylaminoacyl peptidase